MSDLLAARAAIEDLVHTYALRVRNGLGGQCLDLFTEDAVFEIRKASVGPAGAASTRSRLIGSQEIASYLERSAAPDTRVCPFIHNLLIEVRGHQASSNCLLKSLVWSTGQQIVGEYQDSFRYDSQWRFCARIFTLLGELPPT